MRTQELRKIDLTSIVQKIFEGLIVPKSFRSHCKKKLKGLALFAEDIVKRYERDEFEII